MIKTVKVKTNKTVAKTSKTETKLKTKNSCYKAKTS